MRRLVLVTALAAIVCPRVARAVPYDERPAWQRAGYTAYAVIANIVPIAPSLVAPKCLPGYVMCKIAYAGMSVVAASGILILSGDHDIDQAEATVRRGFGGDWYLTGRHMAGDVEPNVLPEAVPVAAGSRGAPTGRGPASGDVEP